MIAALKKSYASLRPDGAVALWLGVWWVCNLLQAGFTELANDEPYYHMFAERLAWGYFDHPPLTALLIRLGEGLFGAGEFGVRFFFTLLQPLYLWVLWRIVRPADADRRDASLFVLLSSATLILQLYGFIAVPDGPLMMTAALFLRTFQRFSEERPRAWLWMGVAMAAMAYAKYHGALVVLFALAANPGLLLRPKLYMSGGVALLLLVPHLVWEWRHDWASFAYHLAGRNRDFQWSYLTDYLANVLVVFNPLFVPLYVRAWFAARPRNAVERALRLFPAAFILFFLLSAFRGYVQPQWLIVSSFGLIWALFVHARRHPRTRRYLMRAGAVTLALVALTRLVMVFNPLGIRFEIFDNRTSYGSIARIAAGRPVLFRHSYAVASKYRFYTGGETYCQPDIRYRNHQWQYRTDDDGFASREVVVETTPPRTAADSARVHSVVLANGYRFTWMIDRSFRPVRRVDVAIEGLPVRCAPGDTLRLTLRLSNPYSHAVEVDGERLTLAMLWKYRRSVREFPLANRFTIPPGGETTCRAEFVVPEELGGKEFEAGFALVRPGYVNWYNGKPLRTEVAPL